MLFAVVVILCVFVAILFAEFVARLLGIIDFPLYDANSRIGYIPKARQSGIFFKKVAWAINEKHMGTWRPFHPGDGDVLLIGDSIVYGGNAYRGFERLGPQLEAAIGRLVWPVSAPSWSLQNELQYLLDNPEVLQGISRIIFVVNSRDYGSAAYWRSPLAHPRERPRLALWHLVVKYLIKPKWPKALEEMRVPDRSNEEMFREVRQSFQGPIDIFFYAHRDEFVAGKFRDVSALEALNLHGATIHCATVAPYWTEADYRDTVHPTPEGYRKLATAIGYELGYPARAPERVSNPSASTVGPAVASARRMAG